MQYLLLIHSNETGWPALTPAQQQQAMADYGAYTEAVRKAGVLLALGRLHPSATATIVRVSDGRAQVLDGPYADSKEQLGGYYLLDVADLDAAIAWASRCPGASHGAVEVRPVWA